MPRLYASVDAFVVPSRGEGFGMPFMEAMAMVGACFVVNPFPLRYSYSELKLLSFFHL